ncbi:uncharacterized protein LOC129732430 [Wyeomyia smithii]|uniref:uncharacterized protein LOC129732430 n=1 Tax=Wyeomyia smithii TaxID=174621 RepID=UPI002467CF3A|nr:uncharacterized protein LOC129732430 [Wyeomyia smithii]
MKRVWTVIILALCAANSVYCSFGLNVTVPGYTDNVNQFIDNGINAVIRANATIKISAESDSSGTIGNLIFIANNVTTPLNKLLGSILAASAVKNASIQDTFANLSTLVTNTKPALSAASNAAKNLQEKTKDFLYQVVNGNLTALSTMLTNLSNGLNYLKTQVQQAANEQYPLSSQNITIYLNSTVLSNVTTPLQAIKSSLTNVAAIITVIGSERTQAVNYLSQVNTTLHKSLQNIQNAAAAFNHTVLETYSRISTYQVNAFKAINQTYATIALRGSAYNGGDISNLTMFLSDLVAANDSFSQLVSLSTNYTMEQFNPVLQDSMSAASKMILTTAGFVANQSTVNESDYTYQCTARIMQRLQQNPLLLTRLSRCIQQESNAFQPTTTFAQFQMDLVKNAAVSIANQLAKTCQRPTGLCAKAYFAALPDHSQMVQNKVSVIAGGISNDEHIVTGRTLSCIHGTTADIIENARFIRKRFNKCLLTGP